MSVELAGLSLGFKPFWHHQSESSKYASHDQDRVDYLPSDS